MRCKKLPKCCPFDYWCKHNAAILFASYLIIFAGAFVMIILHSGWIKGCNTKCWVKRQNVNETFIQLRNNEIPLARDVSSRGTRVDLLTDSRASLCARPLHICLYYSRDDWLLVHAYVGLYYCGVCGSKEDEAWALELVCQWLIKNTETDMVCIGDGQWHYWHQITFDVKLISGDDSSRHIRQSNWPDQRSRSLTPRQMILSEYTTQIIVIGHWLVSVHT